MMSLVSQIAYSAEPPPDRWESAIRQFEATDQKSPPPKQAILFVGSSTIVGWDLKKFFPEWTTVNRGFGGSEIADSTRYADRIIIPYDPKLIVFYAGDNDVANGKSAETVAADLTTFVAKVRAKLPDVPILFIAIKPSIQRWKLIETQREANHRIEEFCRQQPAVEFLGVESLMLGDDGKPNAALFQADGLHLSADGYERWSAAVRKQVQEMLAAK